MRTASSVAVRWMGSAPKAFCATVMPVEPSVTVFMCPSPEDDVSACLQYRGQRWPWCLAPSTAERERPAEPGELAGDGDVGDVGALPPRPQVEVPAVQPPVRPRGDPRRLGREPRRRGHVGLGGGRQGPGVVPGGLDEEPPDVRVAGLGDPALEVVSPDEDSDGTSPTYDMSALGLAKREKSPISTAIPKAVTVETPRSARSLEVTPARSAARPLSAMAASRRSRRSSHSLTCATYSSTSRSHGSSSLTEAATRGAPYVPLTCPSARRAPS